MELPNRFVYGGVNECEFRFPGYVNLCDKGLLYKTVKFSVLIIIKEPLYVYLCKNIPFQDDE